MAGAAANGTFSRHRVSVWDGMRAVKSVFAVHRKIEAVVTRSIVKKSE